MPWVDKNECTGCGICVEECPVDTIFMENEKAEINMDNCIRCGICHTVCPENVVKHDSEKIPQEVEANIVWTKTLLEHYDTTEEKKAFLVRMGKHFNKEKVVAQKTIEQIELLKELV